MVYSLMLGLSVEALGREDKGMCQLKGPGPSENQRGGKKTVWWLRVTNRFDKAVANALGHTIMPRSNGTQAIKREFSNEEEARALWERINALAIRRESAFKTGHTT